MKRNSIQSFLIFIGILILMFSVFFVSYNSERLIEEQARLRSMDAAIVIAKLIEEDLDSYQALTAAVMRQEDPRSTQYYKKMNDNLADLKKDMDVAFIYTFTKLTQDRMIYILDADDPESGTYYPPGMLETVNAEWEKVFQTDGPSSTGLDYYGDGFGNLISGYAPIHDKSNQIIGFVGVDLSMAQATMQFLSVVVFSLLAGILVLSVFITFLFQYVRRKSSKDLLTGLQNRQSAWYRTNQLKRYHQLHGALLLDLDEFKQFNNLYGEEMANRLLVQIGLYLRQVVGKNYIFRYGGDEFLVLLHRRGGLDPEQIAEQIQTRFKDSWLLGNQELQINATIGIMKDKFLNTPSVQELYYQLEYCVDQAKRKARGSISSVDDKMLDHLSREKEIQGILRKEVERRGFFLEFQPIYSTRAKGFQSAEGLLRLEDPVLGRISPAEFIPIAEKSGMIVDVGLLALEKVCSYLRQLEEQGIPYDAISLNLSPLQITDPAIVEKILKVIEETGANPSKIRFEITESTLLDEFDTIKIKMEQLGKHGIRFYLDDFGTGCSNLAMLVRLNFEAIKLDKSLLTNTFQCNDKELIGEFISIFQDFGWKVVVEGVENKIQQRMVMEYGADYIQGFYYSRPVSGEETMEYLLGKNPDQESKSSH